jgi:predicted nucleic acid-binding protein
VRAALVARARAEGKAIAPATAMTHGLIVATRNSAPFEAAGLTVINPWKTQHRRD